EPALCAPSRQQVFDGVPDLARFAVEQMVCRVDDDELLGVLATRVELLHILQWAELVAFALNEELRLRAAANRLEIVTSERWRDADERRDVWIACAHCERDPGAERKARRPERRRW